MNQPMNSLQLSNRTTQWLTGITVVGVLLSVAGFMLAPLQTAAGLLLVSYYLLSLGLAGIAFVAFQYVTGAGWSVGLRRVPEAMAAILPIAAVLLLTVLLCFPSLYPWDDPSWHESHSHSSFKTVCLTRPFFLARALAYVAIWLLFAYAIVRTSRQQDRDADLKYTRRNVGLSAGFLVALGVTCWLASYDWIMSLEPEWYSTIFGVYHFAGLFLSGLSAIICLLILLQRLGPFRTVLTKDHLHDLGKLLFGMSTFWAYIWYCQYMLIWYVNNPEETGYYVHRLHGVWQPLFWVNIIAGWVVPFFVLLPRQAKRSASVLWKVSLVVLCGRWLDLYLMIFPAVTSSTPYLGLGEIGWIVSGVGIFLLVFFRAFQSAATLAVNDPYLIESVPHCTFDHRLGVVKNRLPNP